MVHGSLSPTWPVGGFVCGGVLAHQDPCLGGGLGVGGVQARHAVAGGGLVTDGGWASETCVALGGPKGAGSRPGTCWAGGDPTKVACGSLGSV